VYPVSEKFARYITGDHERTTRIWSLLETDATPVDISAWFEGGSITQARQEIRRSGTLTFVDDGSRDAIPNSKDHPLAPYGQELFVEHGVVYPDDTEELVPQGVFRITNVKIRYPFVTCTINDRAWTVDGNKLEEALTIASGRAYTDAIGEILQTAYPDIVLHVVDIGHLTPTLVLDAFSGPMAECLKMATAIGYQLYFDRLGEGRLEPDPDNSEADPVVRYRDGSDVFLPRSDEDWFNLATYDQELEWDTTDAVNAINAIGENTDNASQFSAWAYDLDPTSPTRWGGRFGRRPLQWVSEKITSSEMAEAAATTELQKRSGISEGLRVPSMPHPGLDVNDPMLVVRHELGINQIHVADAVPLPLRASGDQVIETRRRRVVLTNE
jgi:hypothetical protein